MNQSQIMYTLSHSVDMCVCVCGGGGGGGGNLLYKVWYRIAPFFRPAIHRL